ncbi:hypothetical protein AB0F57_07065 [Streptomyces tanashiensis]
MTALGPGDVEALTALDATAQAQLIRTGEATAEGLVTAAITRIEALTRN